MRPTARGWTSNSRYTAASAARPPRIRAGGRSRAALIPLARIATISPSADIRPNESSTPKSSAVGSA